MHIHIKINDIITFYVFCVGLEKPKLKHTLKQT